MSLLQANHQQHQQKLMHTQIHTNTYIEHLNQQQQAGGKTCMAMHIRLTDIVGL